MNAHRNPLAAAEHSAHFWLATVADELGTEDPLRAQRVLRSWLHVVRDQLPVNGAVHLGAQLPEFLRGVYYEDWTPERHTARSSALESVGEFAAAAELRGDQALPAMAAVTSALRERFSPGQLDHALVQLRPPLRSALRGDSAPGAATQAMM